MSISIVDEFSICDGSIESIFVKANIPGFGKLVIVDIYRPPNKSISYANQIIFLASRKIINAIHTERIRLLKVLDKK